MKISSNPAENTPDAGFPLFRLDDISAITLKTLKITLIFSINFTICADDFQSFVKRAQATIIIMLSTANSLDTAQEKTE